MANCGAFSSDLCSRMLIEILARPESKQLHLEFLLNKFWKNKSLNISASTVSFQHLIGQKSIKDNSLLNKCLELGLPALREDIEVAVDKLSDKQLQVFELLASKIHFRQEELEISLCGSY